MKPGHLSKQVRWQHRHEAAGLCRQCPKKAVAGGLCQRCRDKLRVLNRAYRRRLSKRLKPSAEVVKVKSHRKWP